MNDDAIAELVAGRAQRHLRSMLVLATTAAVVATSLAVFVVRQRAQTATDFVDNETLHVVEVLPRLVDDRPVDLTEADARTLASLVARNVPAADVDVTVRRELGFGIPDRDGTTHFLVGLDGPEAGLLVGGDLEPDVLLAAGGGAVGQITLDVPVVEVEDGGMSSASTQELRLERRPSVDDDAPLLVLGRESPDAGYVDGSTFARIAETAYATPWETLSSVGGSATGQAMVRSVYLGVADLDDVQAVAVTVRDAGYDVRYTLQAFDDLASSVRASLLAGGLAGLIVVLGAASSIRTSVRSYQRLARRDLGILRHAGFSPERLQATMVRPLRRQLVTAATLASGWGIGLWAIASTSGEPRELLVVLLVPALLFVIGAGTVTATVHRYVRLPVLELLRAEREFA